MIDHPDEELAIAYLPGPHRRQDLLWMAEKASRISPVQILRADRVVHEAHLRSAAMHARRAFAEGRNQADRLEVEFTRYVAGRRQIKNALGIVGLPDEPGDVVVCALGPRRDDALRYFVDGLGLKEGEFEGAGDEALTAFGVTQAELDATTPAHRLDIILERVAAVDLMRK